MCRICDIFEPEDRQTAEQIYKAITHREPDDEGVYADDGIILGHPQLSMIDLGHDVYFRQRR